MLSASLVTITFFKLVGTSENKLGTVTEDGSVNFFIRVQLLSIVVPSSIPVGIYNSSIPQL